MIGRDILASVTFIMPNSTLEMRRDQMFPVLEPNEVERLRRFGTVVAYAEGDSLFRAGEIGLGMFIILKGNVAVSRKDALGHAQLILEEGAGAFLAELNQLSGRPALVDAHAKSAVEALVVPAERLRALLIAEAELGEQIMRALILRRVGLIEEGPARSSSNVGKNYWTFEGRGGQLPQQQVRL